MRIAETIFSVLTGVVIIIALLTVPRVLIGGFTVVVAIKQSIIFIGYIGVFAVAIIAIVVIALLLYDLMQTPWR